MKRVFLAVVAVMSVSCGPASNNHTTQATPAKAKEVSLADVGLSAQAIDDSVDPCTDFYQYACGGWLKATEIPADQARWSRGFSEVRERNRRTLHDILEKSAKAATTEGVDPNVKKVGDYYAACMDTEAIEAHGLEGVDATMDEVSQALRAKGIEAAIATLHQHRIWVVFDISAEQDFKDATNVIAYLDQNGLGLPDRDYYLKDDKKEIRDAYRAHVQKMFELSGWSEKKSAAAAGDVMAIETAFARASMPRVERRNPYNIYHKKSVAELKELAGGFWWEGYFKGVGLDDVKSLNVMVPDFFKGFATQLQKVKRDQWLTYFRWHVLSDAAGADALPEPFLEERFKMRAVLTGQEKQQERWKRCVDATDDALGELVGQVYVEQKFPGKSKEDAEAMVHAISDAFEANLQTLEWMDAKTRERASSKREMMVYKIGYPDEWRKYPFTVMRDDHFANVMASAHHELERDLNEIGKPVDRKQWFMSPATVNAYYNPLLNEMVFPAGILQSPFYSVDSSAPVNLGAMGMIVGHELTHGFDDGGAKFAGDGNLKNWWEEPTGQKFEEKTQCVVQQYNGYSPIEGLHVNGELTLGENIADIGGAKMAFHAYRKLRKDATDPVMAGGFNEDQQFFLGLAQAWCTKQRDEYTKLQVQTDPHSPAQYRVNGTLVNMPEFGKAFDCEEGTRMRPADRCEVW